MNSKIVSSVIATAGVAVGVVGITMGGASSTPVAAKCDIPAMDVPSPSAASVPPAVAAPAAVAGTLPATGGSDGAGGASGTEGSASASAGNGGSLVDVNVNPGSTPSGFDVPTLPTPSLGDIGGLLLDLDAHADTNQSNSNATPGALVTVDGRADTTR